MNILEQFDGKINGILETFDRMIIKGHIRQFYSPSGKQHFTSYNNILYKDFGTYANKITDDLCSHIDNYVNGLNRPIIYLSSARVSKEKTALDTLKDSPTSEGLIASITTVETCDTIQVEKNKENRLLLKTSKRKCKYYYLYYFDKEFGFMHYKIQTWFPFQVQIYINGREYLSKLLDKENIKYERYDNCFTYIEDISKAQELADKISSVNLTSRFDYFSSLINNYLPTIYDTFNQGYLWCVDQCEYATDIMFNSREYLEEIFPSLVEFSFFSFNCDNIMSFLGKKLDLRFQGEVVSDLRKRTQGFRVKHKVKKNQIKMYDKANVLRIETTINDPYEFKVQKEVLDSENHCMKKVWRPMGKSISNLYRYAEICKAINKRYIEALNNVVPKVSTITEVEKISVTTIKDNRKTSGFNVWKKETTYLFSILSDPSYLIHGFRNEDIRCRYFKDDDLSINDIKLKNKTTRLLSKLRAHGIIKKTSKANRYYLTNKGRKITSSILYLKNKEYPIFYNSIA